jgi:hypothetical protein
MIPEFIIVLSLVAGLSVGDYKQREAYTHSMTLSNVTFAQLHMVRKYSDDPEVLKRLKDIAFYKWCIETDEKYRVTDYYGNVDKVNFELQLEDFTGEWK